MDVNAVWAPHALESTARILAALRALGAPVDSLVRSVSGVRGTPLERWARDEAALRAAIATWHGASRHFVVRLGPNDVRERVTARLAAMPAAEREYWQRAVTSTGADRDSLVFLAVALDAAGRPIGVANTDPATRLFLGDHEGAPVGADSTAVHDMLRDVRLFARSYPVGLLVAGVGPVVANDAYAPSAVWRAFERDAYHGPRVVWGREVNLFLLGVSNRIAAARTMALVPHVPELRSHLEAVRSAVRTSGFRSELWSYEVRDGRVVPVRYGTGSDIQLWSTSDLAVEFALSRMK
jgi:hypothetical protein